MKKNKKMNSGTFTRVIKMLFKFFPVLLPVTIFCILFSGFSAARNINKPAAYEIHRISLGFLSKALAAASRLDWSVADNCFLLL